MYLPLCVCLGPLETIFRMSILGDLSHWEPTLPRSLFSFIYKIGLKNVHFHLMESLWGVKELIPQRDDCMPVAELGSGKWWDPHTTDQVLLPAARWGVCSESPAFCPPPPSASLFPHRARLLPSHSSAPTRLWGNEYIAFIYSFICLLT